MSSHICWHQQKNLGLVLPHLSEILLIENDLRYVLRQVFQDFDSDQETIILKHKQVAGEDLPDERQQEPLSFIRL